MLISLLLSFIFYALIWYSLCINCSCCKEMQFICSYGYNTLLPHVRYTAQMLPYKLLIDWLIDWRIDRLSWTFMARWWIVSPVMWQCFPSGGFMIILNGQPAQSHLWKGHSFSQWKWQSNSTAFWAPPDKRHLAWVIKGAGSKRMISGLQENLFGLESCSLSQLMKILIVPRYLTSFSPFISSNILSTSFWKPNRLLSRYYMFIEL